MADHTDRGAVSGRAQQAKQMAAHYPRGNNRDGYVRLANAVLAGAATHYNALASSKKLLKNTKESMQPTSAETLRRLLTSDTIWHQLADRDPGVFRMLLDQIDQGDTEIVTRFESISRANAA